MTESQSKRTTDLLEIFYYEGLEHTEISCETLLQNLKRKLNIELNMVTNEKFTKDTTITRQLMANWLRKSVEIMRSQASLLCSYKDIVDTMKNDAIADKNKVMTVQEKLLEMKDQQLNNLKSAVQSTVQNSVEKEIKQYSQVLTQNSTGNGVCHDTLKSVVKTALKKEDRSKNLVVFGLVEHEKENLEDIVGELLLDLGEKPRMSVNRIGARISENRSKPVCRPVKVTLLNSNSAHQILLNAKNLKHLPKYKSVYICPDRSKEERVARRALVNELKEANMNQPGMTHFIRNGKVHSVEKG